MQVTHAWYYSRRLQRDMQLITYGSKGYPFLVFPTQDGKAGQWEDFGMIEVLRPFIENGAVRLYCIDSVDQESWSDTNGDKSRRAQVQEAYDISWSRTDMNCLNISRMMSMHSCRAVMSSMA